MADEVKTAPQEEETTVPEQEEQEQDNEDKRKLEELTDKYLRVSAEYDNYRKRTAKEKELMYGDARAATVLQLLPVLDNLRRAAKQASQDEAYAQGVAMIEKQFTEILERMGVTEIEAEGQSFDPTKHEAVMHIEDPELAENVICEVFTAGFALGDRVIRPSMVKVAN